MATPKTHSGRSQTQRDNDAQQTSGTSPGRLAGRGCRALLAAGLLLITLEARGAPRSFSARCVGVVDGDTLAIQVDGRSRQLVDLHGVDCPEIDQPFGVKARQFAAARLLNRPITVHPVTKDHRGRMLARVVVDDTLFNEAIVAAGYAWQYTAYLSPYRIAVLEKEARTARRGLWLQPRPTPPWEWRESRGGQ